MSSQSATDPFAALSDRLAETVAHAAPSIVTVIGRGRYSSSGFVWRPGVVVTAPFTRSQTRPLKKCSEKLHKPGLAMPRMQLPQRKPVSLNGGGLIHGSERPSFARSAI